MQNGLGLYMNKELGKIEKCFIGFGGYQDAMFGMTFILTTNQGSIQDFINSGFVDSKKINTSDIKVKLVDSMIQLLSEAKVNYFNELINKPVELTLDQNKLVSWRILTEVL
jgi:hypothetical protein